MTFVFVLFYTPVFVFQPCSHLFFIRYHVMAVLSPLPLPRWVSKAGELDLHPTSGLQLSAEAEKIDRDGSCTIVD